ncbi:MAG: B12-binding domain-containing radical SAM protein [Candidatus Diapherotrites archaeon]|nr:B12-binding domain-containing radical SAM protein [Candidatus Diapherotrites archaeon]
MNFPPMLKALIPNSKVIEPHLDILKVMEKENKEEILSAAEEVCKNTGFDDKNTAYLMFLANVVDQEHKPGDIIAAMKKYKMYDKFAKDANTDVVVIIIDYLRCANESLDLMPSFTKKLKEENDSKIILAGPLMYKNDLEVLSAQFEKLPHVDAICYGEDEVTVPQACEKLLNGENPGDIDGVGVRGKKTFKHTFVKDLNTLPIPDYSDTRMEEYLNYRAGTPSLTVWASRGCTAKCVFCDETNIWHPYRSRNPELVAEEMKHFHKKYKIKAYRMNDLLLNGDLQHLNKLCDLLKGNNKFFWGGMARAESSWNRALFDKMYDAGCRFLWFGIESYSEKMIEHMKKRIDPKEIIPITKAAKDSGMRVVSLLIDKFPGQTENDVKKTKELIKMLKENGCQYHVTNFRLPRYSEMGRHPEKFGLKLKTEEKPSAVCFFEDLNKTYDGQLKDNPNFWYWPLEGTPIVTEF